jgi:hypothetical protein
LYPAFAKENLSLTHAASDVVTVQQTIDSEEEAKKALAKKTEYRKTTNEIEELRKLYQTFTDKNFSLPLVADAVAAAEEAIKADGEAMRALMSSNYAQKNSEAKAAHNRARDRAKEAKMEWKSNSGGRGELEVDPSV